MPKDGIGKIEYVVVYDVQRVLYNGAIVSVCNHGAHSLGGFTSLELAVSARGQMYAYFAECGQPLHAAELVITPILTGVVSSNTATVEPGVGDVWTKPTAGDNGAGGAN